MIDNRTIFTRIKVAKLEIETDNSGLKIAWNFIRGKITSAKFASIVFQDREVLESKGIGGFYTNMKFVNILYLCKDYYDEDHDCLRFKNESDAAIFLHECSHYLHLVSNNGVFKQSEPSATAIGRITWAKAQSSKERYYAEREAWHISLSMNRTFRLNMLDAINLENAKNMLCVEASMGLRKFDKDEFEKIAPTLTIDNFHMN